MYELADSALEAAIALAEEHKARTAAHVGGVAAAVRAAARSFEESDSPRAADYTERAASQIAAVAEAIHERRWADIVAEVNDAAHRQPVLFAAAVTMLGFLAARFWTASQQAKPGAAEGTTAAPKDVVEPRLGGDSRLLDRPPASGPSNLR